MIKKTLLRSSAIALLFLVLLVGGVSSKTSSLNTSEVTQIAQGTSDEATPESETLEETTEDAIKEIKKRIEENTSKVRGVLDSMLHNKQAIVGEVQRINENALTFENKQGTTILAIEDDVSITKKGTKINIADIAVGDWVTVLGYKDDEDFTPRIITVSATSLRPDTQLVLLGLITDISSKKVSIIDRDTGEKKTVAFTKSSLVKNFNGEEASIDDLEEDVTVLVVATTTDEEDAQFKVKTIKSLAPLDELK